MPSAGSDSAEDDRPEPAPAASLWVLIFKKEFHSCSELETEEDAP